MNTEILIVDDETDIRSLLSLTLEDEGFSTVQAANAEQARDIVSKSLPSCAILDIWMRDSDMDGLEFLKQIRNLDRLPPVILITGHGDVKLAVESLKLGATDFFEKPFDPKELLSQTKLLHGQRIEISANFKSSDNSSLKQMTEEFERMRILHSLKKNSGSILSVMKELKLPRRTLNEKMVKYQISRQKFTIR